LFAVVLVLGGHNLGTGDYLNCSFTLGQVKKMIIEKKPIATTTSETGAPPKMF